MDHALDQLTRQWSLNYWDRHRLIEARAAGAPDAVDQCLDISSALRWLLADQATIHAWLRTPHAALYHQAPLELALGSAAGRSFLRSTLMSEAAACGDLLAEAGQVFG